MLLLLLLLVIIISLQSGMGERRGERSIKLIAKIQFILPPTRILGEIEKCAPFAVCESQVILNPRRKGKERGSFHQFACVIGNHRHREEGIGEIQKMGMELKDNLKHM